MSILLITPKNKLFVFIDFLYCFTAFYCIDFCLYIYYFLPSLCFRFILIFLFIEVRAQIIDFNTFFLFSNISIQNAILFPLNIALAMSHKFWHVLFSFSSMYFFFTFFDTSSLMHELCYVEMCCVISKCLEISLLSFCCWFLVWILYSQRIYHMI